MKIENVVVETKVQVKTGAPNSYGLFHDQNKFDGKFGVIIEVDSACPRGLTVRVKMDDRTVLDNGRSPWFSHKDLKRVKGDVK
jgi:hypothetical protein